MKNLKNLIKASVLVVVLISLLGGCTMMAEDREFVAWFMFGGLFMYVVFLGVLNIIFWLEKRTKK